MRSHNVWILGTPIYWVGPTAQLKAFLDRWYAPWSGSNTRNLFDGRRAVVVTSMESAKPKSAQPTVEMLTRTLNYLGIPIVAHVAGAGAGLPPTGTIEVPPETLQHAFQVGRDLLS